MESHAQIARRTQTGRLAGILFIVGALASIPANLLFRHPEVGVLNHIMVAIALVSGLGCLVAPWDRIPDRVFHAVPLLASAECALTVWAVGKHGPVYEWFFVLVAVFAAYAFESRRAIGFHMLVCTAAAALPFFYRDDVVEQVARIGVLMPMLWVATAVVMYLREGLVAGQRELADLARRDPLTGVGNRRLLAEHLNYEIARHRRTGRELAVLLLDLDRFKEVNDALGHPAGDRLLRGVADTLLATVRTGDTVVRHGGDEFCIVAPETGAAEAEALGGRIHDALAAIEVLGSPLTATVGAAVFPDDGPTPELLLDAADGAERSAKSGRHRQLALEPEPALRIV
ncbi:MAG: diguanylate cyclase domain-containing protein [Solirubrobacteraceae bacterium]